MAGKKLSKGARMEEALRAYFSDLGYFVVRSVPFKYEGFDVTDIDLWLYTRTSSVARHRAIVDIKNKKTPQAIERIFWVCGLKKALSVEQAIVATTDKRAEVKDFGREMNVTVLDGVFTARLEKKYGEPQQRMSEDEFLNLISSETLGKLDGDWRGRYEEGKSRLAYGLSFDSCNIWLEHGRFFAEQIVVRPQKKEAACRLLYAFAAFLCIGVDFILKELAFSEAIGKKKALAEGFTYGSSGAHGAEDILDAATGLVEQFAPNGELIGRQVRERVKEEFGRLRSNMLSEYFGRAETARTTFQMACALEQHAMERTFRPYPNLEPELQGVMGVLLDYWDIERKSILRAF